MEPNEIRETLDRLHQACCDLSRDAYEVEDIDVAEDWGCLAGKLYRARETFSHILHT
jgi:hypothetical protein